ncbi:MAG TPA: dTMP kinase [Anaeromyxobacteraceae bacterium]|nr:dTMP kinase [Anaeromyxobacteraceae bacterium]
MRWRGRGRFLVLEGLDGAGTTTQAELLASWLRGRGRKVHLTAEPSRGPVGALVRQILTGRVNGGPRGDFDPGALALLFAADRLDHVASEVEPRLAAGWDVVSDRYVLSSLAYQSVAAGGAAWIGQVNARAPAPDLTVFLEVRPAVGLRRRFAASAERELFEVPAFQRRVAAAYRRSIASLRRAGQRVEVLSGEAPVAEVAAAVARAVARLG